MFEGMFEIFNEEKKEGADTEVIHPSTSSRPSYPAGSSDVFVISVGGSILMDGKPKVEAISRLSNCLNDLIRQGNRLVLVVGGGKVARDYVNAAKELGANNFELDELGIKITRANASLLLTTIENAFPRVLTNVKKAESALASGKTPIFGGLMPGFTTDAVAALLAEYLNATFINLSNVEGIFTADPAAYPGARMYHELSYGRLLEILAQNAMKPGQNLILDLPAAMILKRSAITAFFLSGHDLENIKSAVQGMQFHGTVIRPEAEEVLEGDEEEPALPKPRKRRSTKRTTARKKAAKKKRTARQPEEAPHPDNIRF